MSYTSRAAIEAIIPSEFIAEALDDDNDGAEDAGLFDKVLTQAELSVDAYLQGRYTTPISAPIPAVVSEASRTFFCEMLHDRRGHHGESNPFTEKADGLRMLLGKIGSGMLQLTAESQAAKPPVSVITQPSRVNSGNLLT